MNAIPHLTQALRTGIDQDTSHGAVIPPLYSSSNFTFDSFGQAREFDYTRSGNPTRALLGSAIAELEGGTGASIVATGMAAVALPLIALLKPGDTVAYPHDCYGGSWRLFQELGAKGHFSFVPIDFTDTSAAAAEITRLHPALVWLESPSNPLLRITDIAAISTTAHSVGALVAVDNTFLTPILQRPFDLGADVVVHSVTKYLNGHSDVVQGAVVARTQELHEACEWWSNVAGLSASPYDAHQVLRGLRTLDVRIERHQENAAAVVAALEAHPAVARTYYPGLPNHPGHELARAQQHGFGAMLSFELHGGEAAARSFVNGLKIFCLAESLGGVESLVAHPATMTHASMTPEARAAAGITPSLLRLSVGIERAEDLVDDLLQALDAVQHHSAAA